MEETGLYVHLIHPGSSLCWEEGFRTPFWWCAPSRSLLNQINKTLSNMLVTQESSPYSSSVTTKILHFHNICCRHPLQCTVSSLCSINPLFVSNKLRHREGLALNRAPSSHQKHKKDPELVTTALYTKEKKKKEKRIKVEEI